MKTDFGIRFQPGAQCADTGRDVIGQHVAGGIGAVDTVGAVGLHQFALFQQLFRLHHVGHHQEAYGIQPQFPRRTDMLLGHVRLRAMGRHAQGMHAAIPGHVQVLHGADPGQQQGRHFGVLHLRHHRLQVFLVGAGGEAVIDGGAAQAIAMGHLDKVNARFIQGGCDAYHLVHADQVALGVHPVTQAHIVQSDCFICKIHNYFRLASSFVIPGLTRYPVEYCVAEGDSLSDWIPAFAGMTKGDFRRNDEGGDFTLTPRIITHLRPPGAMSR